MDTAPNFTHKQKNVLIGHNTHMWRTPPSSPSVTSCATSVTTATRTKLSPPSLKLLDLKQIHLQYLIEWLLMACIDNDSSHLGTNKWWGNPQSDASFISLFSICSSILRKIITWKNQYLVHKSAKKIPIISDRLSHGRRTINRFSFNDFILFSLECGDKPVHLYHSSSIFIAS